jgi:uncharacterized protein (TIGR02757 family)
MEDGLYAFLEDRVHTYNQVGFIEDDPIVIPHQFSKKQDIELAGFLAATLAWGQRKTIISKCRELLGMMDNSPHDFVLHHSDDDLKPFLNFKHRTFNDLDTLYFIRFFSWFYQLHNSLEHAFTMQYSDDPDVMARLLIDFHHYFFSLPEAPRRTTKHVASPLRKSACKRVNMFLRWMVRKDNQGVDFGIWNTIKPYQLICPCDLHVDRVARKLGLLQRKQTDWVAAMELTRNLRKLDPKDPVKYDFALFGLGIIEKY